MSGRTRIAVFGGDARQQQHWRASRQVIFYKSSRHGGNGELKRFEAALRAGSIDRVVILARWNGHSATRRIRRICRALDVPVEVVA